MEYERVVKCLMLSTSDNDHEALSAVRAANAILSKEKACWIDVFQQICNSPTTDKTDAKSTSARTETVEDWGDIIDGILRRVPNKYHPFLQSVQDYWWTHGRLSTKQEAAVRRFMR